MRDPKTYRGARHNAMRADKKAGGIRAWPLMGLIQIKHRNLGGVTRIQYVHPTLANALTSAKR